MLTYLIWAFFRAIQSFNDTVPRNEEQLIQSVHDAYTHYPRKRLNCTWLTLHSVFNQIILCNGDNNYNIEHLPKEKLKRTGQLHNVLDVVAEVSAFAQIYIPYTPDTDMDETNLTHLKMNTQMVQTKTQTIRMITQCIP